jgi:hypothetical protein
MGLTVATYVYVIAFVAASLLITLRPLPRGSSLLITFRRLPGGHSISLPSPRLLLPVLFVLAAGFVLGGFLGSAQLQVYLERILRFLRDLHLLAPALIQDLLLVPIRWIETAAGSMGLPATLALTLLFLWTYVLVRWGVFAVFGLGMVLVWLFGWFKRLFFRLFFRKELPRLRHFPASLPPPAGFLEPSVKWFVFLLVLGLAALPYAWGKPPLDAFFASLFWAGVWAAILEIRPWLREAEADQDHFKGLDLDAQKVDPIEDLFYEYQRRHPDQILLAWREPARSASDSSPMDPPTEPQQKTAESRFRSFSLTDDHVKRLLEAWYHFRGGGDLAFKETLGGLHFILLAELLHLSVEKGTSVFILCPDGTSEEVRRALFSHFRPSLLTYALRSAVYGEPLGADVCPDVLICPAERLGKLLDDPVFEPFCSQMSLLVALGLDRINRARLRYQMLRISQLRQGLRIQMFFHTETYGSAEPGMKEIAPLHNLKECSLIPDVSAERFLLVWDSRRTLGPEFKKRYLPQYDGHVDAPLLLCWLPWDRDFPITYLDPQGRRDQDLVERIPKTVATHFSGQRARPRTWMKLSETSLGYTEPENKVAIAEDLFNLAEAVYRNYNFDSKGKVLVCVAGGNYLLRDFIAELFHAQSEGGAYRLADKSLLPRVPLARGGLMDLARSLRSVFSSSTGLTRAEVKHFFDRFPFKSLLHELGIDPSPEGLTRLFTHAFGDSVEIEEKWIEKECRYTCRPAAFKDPKPLRLIESVQAHDTEGEIDKVRGGVPPSDYGLCLAKGLYVQLDGRFYQIEKVDPERGLVRIKHEENDRNKRFRYFFNRIYRVEKKIWFEGEPDDVTQGNLPLRLVHWHANVFRSTTGYLMVPESLRPLDEEADGDQRECAHHKLDPPVSFALRWCNVLEIEITAKGLDGKNGSMEKAAFTLCALLQDSLFSIFPGTCDRVAVVSPQADLGRESEFSSCHSVALPLLMYPKYEGNSGDAAKSDALTIYVIEDGEEDLGVVRSLKDDYGAVFKVVFDYLQWAAQQEQGALYHGFGAKHLHEVFDYSSVATLLKGMFPGWNPPRTAKRPEIRVPPAPEAQRYGTGKACDFCADPMGGPHHRFPDGRQYCDRCAQTVVKTEAESKKLLERVARKMESRYHIELKIDFPVEMVEPDRMAEILGEAFIPTDDFDLRTVGLVHTANRKSRMCVEAGAPRIALIGTFAHELTHIWQDAVEAGSDDREIREGQARYIEIDFIRANDGERLADRLEEQAKIGKDIYSRGWRKVQGACNYSPWTVFRCFEQMLKQW